VRKAPLASVSAEGTSLVAEQYAAGVTSAGEMWVAFAVLVFTIAVIAIGIGVLA
jgi:hypothetical protein